MIRLQALGPLVSTPTDIYFLRLWLQCGSCIAHWPICLQDRVFDWPRPWAGLLCVFVPTLYYNIPSGGLRRMGMVWSSFQINILHVEWCSIDIPREGYLLGKFAQPDIPLFIRKTWLISQGCPGRSFLFTEQIYDECRFTLFIECFALRLSSFSKNKCLDLGLSLTIELMWALWADSIFVRMQCESPKSHHYKSSWVGMS